MASALTLLAQGANGTTYDQLKKGLNLTDDRVAVARRYQYLFKSLQKNGVLLANQIYVKKSRELNATFSKIAKEQFLSGVKSLDFREYKKTERTINTFINSRTRQKIRNFIKSNTLSANNEIVLVNALYLKSNWKQKFNKTLTKKGRFYINKSQTIPVEYMNMRGNFRYGNFPQSNLSIIEMNFAKSNLTFIVILPTNRTGLAALEASFNCSGFLNLEKSLRQVQVNLTIPKFKVDFDINLNSVLRKVCTFLNVKIFMSYSYNGRFYGRMDEVSCRRKIEQFSLLNFFDNHKRPVKNSIERLVRASSILVVELLEFNACLLSRSSADKKTNFILLLQLSYIYINVKSTFVRSLY